ncbi:MAG: dehydrogenase E1 component subunit alpha/beta [Actinobacteria bacterium]|nr:dehydrogenase E1 component subunit alpha/beta [Actinomycetota bacterium]
MVKEIEAIVEIKPGEIVLPKIPKFQYQRTLQQEVDERKITRTKCTELLEQMLMVRFFEEMIAEIVAGIYNPLPKFKYIGPSHVSIGQEATSVGSIAALELNDYITSSHRGHGDALAKGYGVIKAMDEKSLRELLNRRIKFLKAIGEELNPSETREALEEKALKVHVYRMIAELFGKVDGYCRGVGGSMHIADFELGHLGANAIVGGHMGIAAGAAISCRYRKGGQIVLCLAGDGAYSNGIAHESINLTAMAQFKNGLMSQRFGVPIIFGIVNNQYAMSGQEIGEITGIDYLARRAAAYDLDAMHAEVVDGMDVLAVLDASLRAASLARNGDGPVLLEYVTYRFKGHSLHDPLSYRDRKEMSIWQNRDPINIFCEKLLKASFPKKEGGLITQQEINSIKEKVWQRNADMAVRAAASLDPSPKTILDHMYAPHTHDEVIEKYANPKILKPLPSYDRNDNGEITYRLAAREALIEEMMRDERVIVFGEDVAEYGGAFGVTNELLGLFGRDRVFNTSISESAIVGSAVGMAMTGLRPIAEIMYDDFILQAMDQIGNQAAKWRYMSGGQISVPMVLRTTIGGGRGYAGQHSQSLESVVAHMPGLIIIAPSDAYDIKGLLKTSIRDNNPVICFEHQMLYNMTGRVPQEEYLLPLGKAAIKREGSHVTVISWSLMVIEALKAAALLEDQGVSVEVIDLRTLVPLDIETVVNSVRKTGRAVVFSQAVSQGSYAADVACQIQELTFDYLDAPVLRLGAPNGVPPTAQSLEKEFLPSAEKLINMIKRLF